MTLSAKVTLQAHLKKTWQGRIGKIIISLVGLLALIILLSWLLLPVYAKRVAVEQVQQQLGRKLAIGEIRFSPFTLALTANDISLYEPDQRSPALSLKTLVLNLSLSSAWHRALVIDEVRLTAPQVHVVRTSADAYGRYNFSDILDKLAAQPKSDAPFRFSLANLQLQNGSIVFDDKVLGKHIKIDELQIAVPFLSNFPKEVNSFIQPMLSAKINGTPFDLKARSKPFVDSLDTTLAIDIDRLNVPAYVAYIPVPLPLKIQSAQLSTKLDLTFSRKKNQAELLLSGQLQLHKIDLRDNADTPLLLTDVITAQIKQINLISGAASLDQLSIEAPEVWLDLDKKGQLNWAKLSSPALTPTPATDQAKSTLASDPIKNSAPVVNAVNSANAANTITAVTSDSKSKAIIALNSIVLSKGQIHFSDALHSSPVTPINLKDIALNIKQLSTDVAAKPASVLISIATEQDAQSKFEGQFSVASGMVDGNVSLNGLSLATYQPLFNPVLAATLAGKLAAQSHIHSQDGQVKIADLNLQLADFSIQSKAKTEGGIAIKSLALSKLELDTATKVVNASSLEMTGLQADVQKDQTATLNLQKFLIARNGQSEQSAKHQATQDKVSINVEAVKLAGAAKFNNASASNPATVPESNAWRVNLHNFSVNDSSVRFDDQSLYPSVNVTLDGISLVASNLSSNLLDGSVVDNAFQTASFKLKTTINRKGKLSLSADASAGLKNITALIDAQTLPVAALYPYFARELNVTLSRGDASAKGKLVILSDKGQAPKISYDGNLKFSDFHMLESGASDDFLEWKSIDLDGINAKLGGNKPTILLRKLSLTDFYARVVLSDKGKLNLQNITVNKSADGTTDANKIVEIKKADVNSTDTANSVNSADAATTSATSGTVSIVPAASVSATTPVIVSTPIAPPVKQTNPLVIRISQTVLRGGNVNFTDNFVRPNYSANLTGVSGTIGAIASDSTQPATIELNGKIDNDAPLVISGTLNPLSSPIFLDIKGSANGMELTRLTPYAAKYAGYAIDKGKLSVQVSYRVENQQLQAQNDVRLDQLTFGERIDSPNATRLPVQLALALLRDNDGKIAINLPISGSLSDPQFSVGGIIWKVFVNLITKAVTSPFALLGQAFGGGEELSYAEFTPGLAILTPDTSAKLDNLAKALSNRTSLRMDILGRADTQTDTEGLRRASLEKKIKQAKLASLQKKNPQLSLEQISLDEGDKKTYIEDVYKAEKFSKPRNVIGIAKTLPPEEAERLILANTPVTPENLRQLAQRRADVVRDYLEQTGGIAKERLFLIAPKLTADGIKDKGLPNRVDFSVK
ncbi:DUF748 domain-containing protein [Undibacterium sp. RTI2.1]|uniref:DUF748 domain-containing protein n=1 Tax=unclassified Undibacterium TaxID=2630295 RepID=UPI002AB33BFF|nr:MULTISPECIES: DUF748 domain-containing protein [unclassified Undibacterium]MDY7536877.1 DUF748 domain-containing protein [Undibacterium sp. 5I1]MEB0029458.1 DUF748 domain-containing protein [Undibacterium sp. RTI2.1]MEB0115644.1 DUF748 domain-containing protein [Undibacterium sp. RTI2.2]MEB0230382.1 DUF748 domain-containing protein [Undibacterium sp. 10I3]MEB0256759.1 DUF748 domain-containing protein [Undibacterium sp. 5I1]